MKLGSSLLRRSGAAAVELALLLGPMCILIVCVWEAARYIEAQQVLNNAVREGARVASTGRSTTVDGAALTTSYVQTVVDDYINRAGFVSDGTGAVTITNVTKGNSVWQTADKGDELRVNVTLAATKVRWKSMTNFIDLGATLSASSTWTSARDEAVVVDITRLGNN